MEQTPRRTCVGCRTTRDKPDLVRIAATPEGVRIDPDQHLPGRGAYVCPDLRCLDAIERTGGNTLRRALRTPQENDQGITAVLSELHRRFEAADDPTDPTSPTPRDNTGGLMAPAGPAPAAGPPPPRSSNA